MKVGGEFVYEITKTEVQVVSKFRRHVFESNSMSYNRHSGDGADRENDGFSGGGFGFSCRRGHVSYNLEMRMGSFFSEV